MILVVRALGKTLINHSHLIPIANFIEFVNVLLLRALLDELGLLVVHEVKDTALQLPISEDYRVEDVLCLNQVFYILRHVYHVNSTLKRHIVQVYFEALFGSSAEILRVLLTVVDLVASNITQQIVDSIRNELCIVSYGRLQGHILCSKL